MLPNFISKMTVDRASCLRSDGGLTLDRFTQLRTRLTSSFNRDVAALFAEPVATVKGDQVEIAWYSERSGEPVPLDALDQDARRVVVEKLRACLATIAPVVQASPRTEFGDLLSRALYVAEAKNILAVGQEPLLIQWAVLAEGVRPGDKAATDQQFAQTLGRYAPFPAPSIVPTEPVSQPESAVAPPVPVAKVGRWQGARDLFAGLPPEARGLAIAIVILAFVALLLTLPGVLASPEPSLARTSLPLDTSEAVTQAMLDKVKRAREALLRAKCNPDGTLQVPPNDGRQGQLPPQKVPVQPGDDQKPGTAATVGRKALDSTVLVLNCVDLDTWLRTRKLDKNKVDPRGVPQCPMVPGATSEQMYSDSHGSGFFIGPKTVLTNSHVVKGAQAVVVTSKFLGHVTATRVVADSHVKGFEDPDFAVLAVETDKSPPAIAMTTSAPLLQDVVAVGFPGVFLNIDEQNARLNRGDANAIPELTASSGFIQVAAKPGDALAEILHSASINPGNSGGPLLDFCAHAVGVNTQTYTPTKETSDKINISLGTPAIIAFLDANNIAHADLASTCGPGAEASKDQPGGTPGSPNPSAPKT